MKNDKQVSPGFILTIASIVIFIAIILFFKEKSKLSNFESEFGQVISISRPAPKKQVATIEFTINEIKYSGMAEMILFSSIKQGQTLKILFNKDDKSEIIIDSIWYKHQISLSIIISTSILSFIVFFALKKSQLKR